MLSVNMHVFPLLSVLVHWNHIKSFEFKEEKKNLAIGALRRIWMITCYSPLEVLIV